MEMLGSIKFVGTETEFGKPGSSFSLGCLYSFRDNTHTKSMDPLSSALVLFPDILAKYYTMMPSKKRVGEHLGKPFFYSNHTGDTNCKIDFIHY